MPFGDHYLPLIRERLKRYNVELPVSSHHYMTNLILRGCQYYPYHHCCIDVRGVIYFFYTKFLMTASALTLLIYTPTPLLLPGGHQFKLFKQHSRLLCRSNYFMNRVINDWNSLPTSVVESTSINTFKSLLDNYLLDFRFTFV